jgi:glycosyltransferase involved in cell wall biosynthesis
MRIAIDLQSCQTDSRDRGIGRYVLSLVGALTRLLRDDDELVLCIDATHTQRMRDVRNKLREKGIAGRIVTYGYPCSNDSNHLPSIEAAAGQLRAKFFESIRPDILLISSFFEYGTHSTALEWNLLQNVPTAAIVYDLIPLVFPDEYLPEGHLITGWYPERAKLLNKFDLLLSISEITRRDLIEHLGIDPAKIEVVGAGFDRTLLGNSGMDVAAQFAKLGIGKPFVLMVGNRDWRKNTIGAIQAFADLPEKLRQGHQLVLTQVDKNIHDALKGEYQHLKDQVIILGKVDEDTLNLLYSKCRVFFFPSFYEGFGLPVLEAMALGAPSLSSCLGALPEVVHNPDMLFDPRNREESSALLRRTLEDEAFRDSLVLGAREHALKFTWERCAGAVLQALRSHSVPWRSASQVNWPTRKDIAVIAEGCLAAGRLGEENLENGLQMIENGDQRRILVDITEIVRLDLKTGIQRVTRNFSAGLADIARVEQRFTVEPFAWTESGIRYAREYARKRLGMDCRGTDEKVVSRPNDLVFMLDSSWWSPERFDRLHSATWQLGGEVVWMVYDLIPIRYPHTVDVDVDMTTTFKTWLSHAVRTADGFICISEATRADLELFIDESLSPGVRRPWSRSVHLGSDFSPRVLRETPEVAKNVLKQIGERPYFTTLGTLEPRKDQGTALDALDRLWAGGCDVALVMMGKRGWNVDKLIKRIEKHRENGRRLFWLESASDGDVQCLLKGAAALIQTSISEGFGLPLVEAGSQGIPLLLSDIPVFHEIAGDEATYFPVGKAKELAAAIEELLRSRELKRPKAIKAMTWRESSASLAKILL